MEPDLYLDRITDDETLAGDLDDADAAALVKAMVARVEAGVRAAATEEEAEALVDRLRAAGRAIGKAVAAWRDDGPEAAAQLALKRGLPAPPPDAKTTADLLNYWLDRIG